MSPLCSDSPAEGRAKLRANSSSSRPTSKRIEHFEPHRWPQGWGAKVLPLFFPLTKPGAIALRLDTSADALEATANARATPRPSLRSRPSVALTTRPY